MILSLIQNTHARSKIVSRDVSREEEEEPFLWNANKPLLLLLLLLL